MNRAITTIAMPLVSSCVGQRKTIYDSFDSLSASCTNNVVWQVTFRNGSQQRNIGIVVVIAMVVVVIAKEVCVLQTTINIYN